MMYLCKRTHFRFLTTVEDLLGLPESTKDSIDLVLDNGADRDSHPQ